MHFTEERARELLFTKPPQTETLREQIESSWFVSRPYGNLLRPLRDELHEHRFQLHPLHASYMEERGREIEAKYLRKRVRRNFAAIVALKRFLRFWRQDFRERYYAPGGGGYYQAMARWASREILA